MKEALGPLAAVAVGIALAVIRIRIVKAILEPEGINWARDWDAVLLGYALGTLGTLVIQAAL